MSPICFFFYYYLLPNFPDIQAGGQSLLDRICTQSYSVAGSVYYCLLPEFRRRCYACGKAAYLKGKWCINPQCVGVFAVQSRSLLGNLMRFIELGEIGGCSRTVMSLTH